MITESFRLPFWGAPSASCLGAFLYAPVKDRLFLNHDPVIVNWALSAPQPGYRYLPREGNLRRWESLCDALVEAFDGLTEADLQNRYGKEPYVESCLRVINHKNVHLRSLWCILGERRVDAKFPEQATHLPP